MSGPRELEQAGPPSPRQRHHDRDPLNTYTATLIKPEEISELILRLEVRSRAPTAPDELDPGLAELSREGFVDLSQPEDVQRAILALGRRLQTLSEAARYQVPVLAHRDLGELVSALLPALEATRLAHPDVEDLTPHLKKTVAESLALFKRNLPARDAHEQAWWQEVEATLHARLVPGFAAAADRMTALEDSPLGGALLRFPWLMGILTALPGLITVPMPVSTPLVLLGLGLVGTYLLHPLYLRWATQSLRDLRQNLAAEAPRIERCSQEEPWPEELLSVDNVLEDLLPILEGERHAGRTSEEALREVITTYFDALAARFVPGGRSDRYLTHLREYCQGHVAKRYAVWAQRRSSLEESPLMYVADTPGLCALAAAIVTLPLSLVITLVTPFPPGVDLPLIIGIFAWMGFHLSRLIPGSLPGREALRGQLTAHQSELDSVP